MDKEHLFDAMNRIGITQNDARKYVLEKTTKIDLKLIDLGLFNAWLKGNIDYLKNVKYKSLVFIKALTSAYEVGTFIKVEDHEKHADQMEVENEEEVKRQAEEWIDLVFELDDDFPSGIYYDAAGKRRGYFDGEGGFVYEGNGQ